jgi:Ca2+-binding EF-hand superfamily protein
MRQMDENFDGRISYQELRMHITSLGFKLDTDGAVHATSVSTAHKTK